MVDGSGAAPEAVPSPTSQRVTAEPAGAGAREPTLEVSSLRAAVVP